MRPADALLAIDELIRTRSILQHPFYLRWQRGELRPAELAEYARVYYPHVAAFPDYLRNVLAHAEDAATRQSLESNLDDELSHPAPHNKLWLDFAEAVDASRSSLSRQSGKAAATIDTFNRLTKRDLCSGLAALYAYESQQPAVAAEKRRGLRENYGVTSSKGLAYFDVHAETDVEHSRAERAGLLACLDNGVSAEQALAATNESLDAYWNLLDAVELSKPTLT